MRREAEGRITESKQTLKDMFGDICAATRKVDNERMSGAPTPSQGSPPCMLVEKERIGG